MKYRSGYAIRKKNARHQYLIRKARRMQETRALSGRQFAELKLQDTCTSVCKDFGFTSVSQAAVYKLAAIFRSKLNEFSTSTRLLMEHAGRTQPIVDDVIKVFECKRINLSELIDYSKQVRSERLHALPVFPVPDQDIAKSADAYFYAMYGPVPSERELETRPEHIPKHFRALHPEWIEDEHRAVIEIATRRVIKSAADREDEEFQKLRRINTYRRPESPETKRAREEEERRVAEEAAYAKKRNRERFAEGITAFEDSDLPNFEDMDYEAMGFFADLEETKQLEVQRLIEEENARKAAAALIRRAPPKPAPDAAPKPEGETPAEPVEGQTVAVPVAASDTTSDATPTVTTAISQVVPDQTAVAVPVLAPTAAVTTAAVITTAVVTSEPAPVEDAGPTFKMSELVKSKPLLKLSGTGSNPGSAPTSRPGSSMSNTLGSNPVSRASTPVKIKFGPGRPKKPKPEGAVVTVPKPKGRPPKKATLEKRKRLSEQIIAQQQKKVDDLKDEKKEKPEKGEKPEKKAKKLTLAEEIRDQLLRARSQMVLPNSVLQAAAAAAPTPAPAPAPPIPTVPAFVIQHPIIEASNVPEVASTVDIETAPIIFDEPAMEVEVETEEAMPPLTAVSDAEELVEGGGEKKKKKEKWDKNSEEYKEYKRQKKERRRKEREDRKTTETSQDSAANAVPGASPSFLAEDTPQNPKLKFKIKFGTNVLPASSPAKETMRPESSSGSRPNSSKGHHHEDAPPPPVNAPPLKFRFKNLFSGGADKEKEKETPKTPETSRPNSSMHVESPSSSSSKHHKKERKDKEHKKHKKDKERSREKEQEREERKERERQKEEAARREIEEKNRAEMESKRTEEEEAERRREKEKRREERRKEKEHRKDKDRHKEKQERRERKEKERELEREQEREREREREREKERERERKQEEEARKKKEVAHPPVRALISQTDSNESDSSEEIWICPVCSVAYTDGANMVGCDQCQDWFHWHCVGLTAEPTDSKWFCNRCSKGNKSKKHGKRSGGPHDSESSAKRKKNF